LRLYRGSAQCAHLADLSSQDSTDAQALDNALQADHSEDTMSKYWKKTLTPDYSRLFGGKWSTDINAAPHDGSTFMGRLKGTNRSFAVKWLDGAIRDLRKPEEPIEICEWISFKDFADTRHCVWNGGENCHVKMSEAS
jgi:hypothetical protein